MICEKPVFMTIRTIQEIEGELPEIMELQTRGTMTVFEDRTEFSYEETDMTGMEGVTTTFILYGSDSVALTRNGENLRSKMVFSTGKEYNSLYEMEFGTLLLTVEAHQIEIRPELRRFEVRYSVAVEHTKMGINTYRVDYKFLS